MLKVEHLTKTIDGREIISDISFSLEKGRIAALLGGRIAGSLTFGSSLLFFYAGAGIAACLSYLALKRLMNLRLSWPLK